MSISGKVTFEKIEQIKEAVIDNNDVKTFTMSDLRDAYGKQRIGKHVAQDISRKLQQNGLGSYPSDLPLDQNAQVRLFLLGTPTSDLVNAVCEPGTEGDQIIADAVSGSAVDIIRDIRALVCED